MGMLMLMSCALNRAFLCQVYKYQCNLYNEKRDLLSRPWPLWMSTFKIVIYISYNHKVIYEHTWAVYSCIDKYQSHPNSLNRRSPHLKRRFLTQAGKTSSRVNFWRVAWYKGCTLCLCQASTFLSLYSSWSFWWGPVKWMLYIYVAQPWA